MGVGHLHSVKESEKILDAGTEPYQHCDHKIYRNQLFPV